MIILRWLINALALIAVAYLIAGISVASFYIALIVALVLGLINAVIRPILIFLTLPINIVTLGLFTLVINGALFWFVASFIQGFEIASFWDAFWGALLLSLISWITGKAIKKAKNS